MNTRPAGPVCDARGGAPVRSRGPCALRNFLGLALAALTLSLPGHAQVQALVQIDPMPEPQAKSAAHATLVGTVRAWNAARQREAQACVNASAGPANGWAPRPVIPAYRSQVTLHWDTPTIFSLAWRQSSDCPATG